jgi:peptidoglycan hydrolase-like protein with peptidoglycan-binding domain
MKTISRAAALLAVASVLAGIGGVASATSASAATTYSCSNETYTPVGDHWYSEFGYYSGNDYVPAIGAFSYATIEAQCLLNTMGANLVVDGYYGPNTQAAVRNFQNTYGIAPYDGLVGPVTWPQLRVLAG